MKHDHTAVQPHKESVALKNDSIENERLLPGRVVVVYYSSLNRCFRMEFPIRAKLHLHPIQQSNVLYWNIVDRVRSRQYKLCAAFTNSIPGRWSISWSKKKSS